jgi:crotonobetainyl-CoA:carnitine CoA-transferase CaiB-like acyl-CoA transferase
VIKIEAPGTGDVARTMGTAFKEGESAIYMSFNRNKRSVTVDLRSPEGREIVYRLVDAADVFLENFRAGTMAKWKLDYETLRARNPRLIYASVSAFGQTGPYSHLAANEVAIQAMSGVMSMTGEPDRPPSRQGSTLPDTAAASFACIGILAALVRQRATGVGEKIETSLLDAEVFALAPREGEYFISGKEPGRWGSSHPSLIPYDAFLAADGKYLHVSAFTEKFWQNLCAAIDRPDLAADPRFEVNAKRRENREALNSILSDIFAARPRAEWISRLQQADVPCAPVNTLGEALSDPQVLHNEMVVDLPHSKLGKVKGFGTPIKLRRTPVQFHSGPPVLSEHTDEVLAEFGYSAEEISQLRARGVV